MKSVYSTSTCFKSLLPVLGLGLLIAGPLRADLNSDLAFTAFSNVDLNALANGQVLQARGGLIDFQRGITAQSLYVIDAELSQVQDKLSHWNPASHPELNVWIHKELPAKPTVADFADLGNLPNNSSVEYLFNTTVNLDPDRPAFQLSKEEAELYKTLKAQNADPKTLFVNFWSQVLTGRSESFFSGKAKNDYYVANGGDIQPLNEIKLLIHSDIKVYIQFQGLLHDTPIAGSLKVLPADVYYESFDIQGGACLGTGATYQRTVGNSVLSADVEYYINNGIYSSLELEELWPITVNGRNETLVWRNDMVSTASVAYLHGTERLASGMIMLQDVKQAVDAFKSEFK